MNENIFRAYDIRGIYGSELDLSMAYYIGYTFGKNIQLLNKKEALVGYDNRPSSIPLSEELIRGITDAGVNVINLELVTTPMVYYGALFYNIPSYIIITASHSPTIYNGMKIAYDSSGCIYGDMIQLFKEDLKRNINNVLVSEKGNVEIKSINSSYKQMLSEKIKLGNRKIKVVVDCGNGTASIVAVSIFENAGCEVIPLYCDSDGSFPHHHPDPAIIKNNQDLINKVIETNADLGIGLDGDSDRIGVIDEKGQMIYADMYMAIIWRDLMPRLTDKRALLDIKCSKALEDEIVKLGGIATYNRTGHSYMKKAMRDGNFAFGGELSGHVFFADEFYGHDDGIYAALRLIRILSNTNRPLSSLLDGINKYYSTHEIIVKVTDDTKFKIIDEMINYADENNYKSLTLDGVKVLFPDGWAIVRASNTGPNLTMRFEAITEERLNSIKNEFENQLKKVMGKYNLNF